MSIDHFLQDEDDFDPHVEAVLSGIKRDDSAIYDLMRELDAIGKPDAETVVETVAVKPQVQSLPALPYQGPDADDPDTIIPEVKLTRWDIARANLREAEAKRDTILAKPVRADGDARRVLLLDHAIEKAKAAMKRAEGDVSRRQEGIDDWRAGEGRAVYNAKRRKREQPNADLSSLTTEQKDQHGKDRRSDANWFRRQRENGIPEPRIQAEFAARIQKREADRAAKAQEDAEEATSRVDPRYGMF
ncbi:hypothetical protein [Fuscibacter oryzae]|uniref:Uncharacterized protein n=1 Tax=Fuscibacter oryzae TaxID=2803939 RepID=A0A8J7SSV3_9RHOB|nr:hypothetical protein [Fuscibacter oryzae]MBL4928010.1 hypothetical protein [Fuscibacter oryzae]